MKLNKKSISIGAKGFCMGMADIVPGVSGGTVALITGIYDELIKSISLVNTDFIKLLFQFKIIKALEHINIKFLAPLMLGILTAIVSMARLMHFFMNNYSVYTWSLFFGLILASIIFVAKHIEDIKKLNHLSFIILGTAIGYGVVSLIPVETSNTLSMIFFSGMISICAMILPGISGSFILLILGKYMYVTSAIKNPFIEGNIYILISFAFGCLLGLLAFSRLLNYLLSKFHGQMMCVLLGFMIGSLKKIWPWREVIEQKIIRGKVHVLKESVVFPTEVNLEVILAFGLMIFGIVLVFVIEGFSKQKASD